MGLSGRLIQGTGQYSHLDTWHLPSPTIIFLSFPPPLAAGRERSRFTSYPKEHHMGKKHLPSRREFLQTAGAAIAVPYVITSAALGNQERAAASDRIVMGGIG